MRRTKHLCAYNPTFISKHSHGSLRRYDFFSPNDQPLRHRQYLSSNYQQPLVLPHRPRSRANSFGRARSDAVMHLRSSLAERSSRFGRRPASERGRPFDSSAASLGIGGGERKRRLIPRFLSLDFRPGGLLASPRRWYTRRRIVHGRAYLDCKWRKERARMTNESEPARGADYCQSCPSPRRPVALGEEAVVLFRIYSCGF